MRAIILCAVLALVGCDGGESPVVDGGDVGDGAFRDAAPLPACERNADCDDSLFCNGAERCEPGAADADTRGCTAGEDACSASQTCREDMSRCESDCEQNADADGDGYRAAECGGDDCDDADGSVNPSRQEICDAEGRDEDCRPDTLTSPGVLDRDGDGYVDAACCNIQNSGANLCGLDCDDDQPAARPGLPEVCDGVDNDCDTTVDEGALTTYYRDEDGDLYGVEADTVDACTPPTGYTANAGDCDDERVAANPGGAEVCNGLDDDCDADLDEEVSPAPATAEHCGACGAACPAGYECDVDTCVDRAVEVDAGHGVICVRTASGAVYCWGQGDWDDSPALVAGVDAVAVGVGGSQACAALTDGDVACWGTNPITGAFRTTPDTLAVPGDAREIAVGDAHAMALTTAGETYIWGDNALHQLGYSDTTDRPEPTRTLAVFGSAAEITAGAAHSCARIGTSVRCFGDNRRGQLGRGNTSTWEGALGVAMVTDVDVIGAGGDTSCASVGDDLLCWGDNRSGQAGQAPSSIAQTEPTEVALLTGPITAADSARVECYFGPTLPPALRAHTCALTSAARVACWGNNTYGALGDGTTFSHHEALQVSGLVDVVDLGVGTVTATECGTFSCAVITTGHVSCWGTNSGGWLQTGTVAPAVVEPTQVVGFPRTADPSET